jgi:hypothetical protein
MVPYNYLFEADSFQRSFYKKSEVDVMINELLQAVEPFLQAVQDSVCAGQKTLPPVPPVEGSSDSSLPSLSTASDSWIEKTYGNRGEEASSVPNQGVERNPPAPGGENQQSGVPVESLRKSLLTQLDFFLSSYNKERAVKGFILMGVYESLGISEASAEKLNRIQSAIEVVSSREGDRPSCPKKAGEALLQVLHEKG